ncbi:trypsin-like peptidase domain-containing protein [Arthrobacter sp. AK01]|uniref:trypsin-like peptidase domain-containing protein n=1 Tax=Micrococcaceae TaxID=1268 RepID=UPI001E573DCD|nr:MULTISPECIES: trypsin-like peptidase domain-containing protein [Micrococcaceae]MCD4849243.1 trypsin-like peptidase domain-containing protein [Arthrobacter sp. AK01]MCP1414751.1 putative serine protease PepD [Paenarthrobacter sp. A20]
MTENPAQGTAPEDREPSEPRDTTSDNTDATATQQQPAWTSGHEPSGQEAGAGNGAQPTTPLPAFQPPASPAGRRDQENAPTQHASQHAAPAQQAPQQYTAQHPGHHAAPAQPSGQPNATQQQPQYYGAPQHQDPANRPNYPQHQPFYGTGANPQGQHGPGMQHAPGNSTVATKRKPAFGVGTLVASMLAAGLIGGGVVAGSNVLWDQPAPAASTSGQSSTVIVNNKDDVNVITAAAAKASPSVVTIKATSGNEGGTGSGIILDDQGHILTNTHVVTLDGATANAAIEVRTSDGKVLKATVVGTDPLSDLAVIKVSDASGLVPATLGDSSKINVGDTAVAIGSPLGLTGTVTDGIVSTLNRTISVASSAVPEGTPDESQGGDEGFQFAPPNGGQSQSTANEGSIAINVIQTDAAINPGNSGGALVNSKGEVIGVNVAIASAGSGTSESSSGNIGVGFSVPINHAKRVAQEIIDTGKASHGQFGVSVRSKSSTGSDSGFSVGAEVASVTTGSAAAKAGLKVGDVVTKFGDYTVSDPNQLTAAVREQPAGAKVKVTIERGGQAQEVEVTLDAAQQ